MSASNSPSSTLNSGGWFTAQTTPQTTVPGVVRTALLHKGRTDHPGDVRVVRDLETVNPFKASYRERLRKLGGLYKPPSLNDACERRLAIEEPGVSLARDTKLMDFSEVPPW